MKRKTLVSILKSDFKMSTHDSNVGTQMFYSELHVGIQVLIIVI